MKISIDSRWENTYEKRGLDFQRQYPNEALVRFIKLNYKNPTGLTALEVGCGSGANLWMLAKEGFETHGLDCSKSALKLAGKLLEKYSVKAKLELGTFCPLPYSGRLFDVIVDVVSLQHIKKAQLNGAYKEIYRCLKPGGKFFTWHTGIRTWSCNPKLVYDWGIENYADMDKNKRMLEDIGFKNIHEERVTREEIGEDNTFHEFYMLEAEK